MSATMSVKKSWEKGNAMRLRRYEGNPVVTAGTHDWRRVTTFNPAVIVDDDGIFYMWERACESLAPLICHVGLLRSEDGRHFELMSDEPVLSPHDFGTPKGTVEDPRVVKIDGRYYMTFVQRDFAAICRPDGVGIPDYCEAPDVPEGKLNNYRSGIAVSDDLKTWEVLGLITPPEMHDRDCVMFPEKVNGRYAMLRRPEGYIGADYGCERPSVWLTYSDDLLTWDEPVLVAQPEQPWEACKIGSGPPPVPTDDGWLVVYHGVAGVKRRVTYRVGAMLLDRDDPSKVIGRATDFFMEPELYYERFGLITPNVVFPTATPVKDGEVYIYYGCSDTCISLATAPLSDMIAYASGK